MRLAILLVGCLGACQANQGDDYGVVPGGGGPTGGSGAHPDAAVDSTTSGPPLMAHVCLLTDPRDPASCATSGVANLTVKLGTASATTADDGSFTIDTPAGSNPQWSIIGDTIFPSIVPFSASRSIPAISIERYNLLLADNGALFFDQSAAVLARIVHGGAPIVGATATLSPPVNQILYDGSSGATWDQDATGTFGTVWLPQIELQPTASMTVTSDGTPTTFDGIPLGNLTITFVTIDQ